MTAVDREALREALAEMVYDRDTLAGDDPWSRVHPAERGRCVAVADRMLTGPLAPLLADAGLRTRVEELAARYDAQHADWCCTKGCAQDDQHVPDDVVEGFIVGGLDAVVVPIPTVPCPGTCTCHIGPQIADLRAVMDPPTDVPMTEPSGHGQRVRDRVTADDTTGIDEIVLHGVDVHIEAMSAKSFTLIFTRPDGLRLQAEMWSPRKPLTLRLFEVEGGHGVHIDDGLLDPPTPTTGAAT